MLTDPHAAPRPLADRPNLRHLKDQARDLVKAGDARSITDAQFKIARLYGFPSWPKLKDQVESLNRIGELKQAIDANDLARVKRSHDPEPGTAPRSAGLWQERTADMGRRMPRSVGAARSRAIGHGEMDDRKRLGRAPGWRRPDDESRAQWGPHSDDGASRRARGGRECPVARRCFRSSLRRANPWIRRRSSGSWIAGRIRTATPVDAGTALDYLIGTYGRSPERMSDCIELLLAAGGTTRYDAPGVLDVLRRPLDRLTERLEAESTARAPPIP